MPSCTPGSSTTVNYGYCLPADGETNWGGAYRSTMTAIDRDIFNVGIPRSYLAGLQTTPTQSSTSVSIAVGVAMGNDQATAIRLTSALVKILSTSWAVGTGNGGLYAATSIQGNQNYHAFVIIRTDTSVVDAYFDTVATAVNIPSPYTIYRRIASFKTDGNSNIQSWNQDGNYFSLATAVLDVNTTNPGTSAITQRLSTVPNGVTMQARFNVVLTTTGGALSTVQFSDLAAQDQAASLTVAPLTQLRTIANADGAMGPIVVRTNVAGQLRYRCSASDGSTILKVATLGWDDTRGRDD